MTVFDDFRVAIRPNLQTRTTWDIELVDCSVKNLRGNKGSVQPAFTRDQLAQLRSRHNWPDSNRLQAIGQGVWRSLMSPALEAAYLTCVQQSSGQQRGTRLVVSMIGNEGDPPGPQAIRLQELPLEALYQEQMSFIAPNAQTPVSRSPAAVADRAAHPVVLPLTVLVVIATPSDKPPANMLDEKNAIIRALQGMANQGGGAIELQFCEPPTREELTKRLGEQFHILHFIGHGAYDIEADDPSPRPYLSLERPDHTSHNIDAETLSLLLVNAHVRLVMMTACASAQPTPEQVQATVGPFDGMAQRLVSGMSDVTAAVAMQFDLESSAAVTFSRSFYTNLLRSDLSLDEIVARCRNDLVGQFNVGRRAWVAPVVYCRCTDGKVFAIAPTRVVHDPAKDRRLADLEGSRRAYLEQIDAARHQPPAIQDALASLIAQNQAKVDALDRQRDELLGETLRLRGGTLDANREVACSLIVRLRTPAAIGTVSCRLRFPADKMEFSAAAPGAASAASVPMVGQRGPGDSTVQVQNASRGAQWAPGELELATLTFRVKDGVLDPWIEIGVLEAHVAVDGVDTLFEGMHGVVFVS